MNRSNYKKIILPILILVLAIVFFVPQYQAHAEGWPWTPTAFAQEAVIWVLGQISYTVGWALQFSAQLLDSFVKISTSNYPDAIKNCWVLLKNFANMFFILFLTITAFSTVLNIKKYSYEKVLPNLLIAALLINFSFAIATYVISLGDGLAHIMLNQIGDTSTRLMDGLGMAKIATSGNAALDALAGVSLASGALFQLIFIIIFFIIALFAILAAAILVIARTVILWAILIFAPIAFLGYAFPDLRASLWKKWWDYLISWTFFLPTYLFFLSLSFIIAGSKGSAPVVTQPADTFTGVLTQVFSFNDLLFYALTLAIMIWGLSASLKVGKFASNGAGAAMGKIQGGIKKYSGYNTRKDAITAGIKAKTDDIKERGVFGIGGEQKRRLTQARWTERFSFGAARGEVDRAKAKEIQNEIERFKKLNPGFKEGNLKAKLSSSSGLEKLALSQLYAQMGWENDITRINETITQLQGTALESYVNSLKNGDFNKIFGGAAAKETTANNINTNPILRKALYEDMAKNNEILTQTTAEKMLELFSAENKETRDKITDNLKNNIKNFNVVAKKNILNTSTNVELKKATAKVMLDNGDLINAELYNSAANQIGTAGSPELAKFEKEARAKNIHLDSELDFRGTTGGLSNSTNALIHTERSDVSRRVYAELDSMSMEELKALTPAEISVPEVHQAIRNGALGSLYGPKIKEIMKSADRKKRKAVLKALNTDQTEFTYT